MTPLADLVATAAPLRAWLQSLPPDEVAGVKSHGTECPAARYLRANGYPEALSGVRVWYPMGLQDGRCRTWPDAIAGFIVATARTRTPLTARSCLALLDRAEREVNG